MNSSPLSCNLTGEVAFVTGAASGIGLAIATRLLTEGARVIVCDVSSDAVSRALGAYPGLEGRVADVGAAAELQAIFHDFARSGISVSILVNNAGIAGPTGALSDIRSEDWQRTLDVNLSGPFHCCRLAAPHMITARHGVIVNISTASARTGLPLRLPYVVSKVGLLGLTHNLARELGPFGIRCNAVLPGPIESARARSMIEARAQAMAVEEEVIEADMLRYISMRTWIDPSEVAAMVAFLASDAARHVTGQSIGVCGNAEWEG